MPFVDHPDDEMSDAIHAASQKILLSMKGMESSVAAMAALHIAMAIWATGGATREQVRKVCDRAAELTIQEREN